MANGSQELKHYTLTDVAKHNQPDDAWVTSGGYVYDVTAFLGSHPGGYEVLQEYLGKDVDEAMAAADHSSYAYNLLKEMMIGIVEGAAQKEHFAPESKSMRGFTSEQLRNAIDFSRPTLSQVATMGVLYWPWIKSRPVCKGYLTLFKTQWMEKLSHYPWWIIWIVWLPTSLFMAYQHWAYFGGVSAVGHYAFGLLTWTLVEYLLHRFVFHHEVSSNSGNLFHFFAHGIHHLTPTDATRLTFPIPFGILVASVVRLGFVLVVADRWWASMGGLLLGYLAYDTLHYLFHHTECNMPLLKKWRSAHMNHHYKNDSMNFGVSSPLWDIILGTYDAAKGEEQHLKKH